MTRRELRFVPLGDARAFQDAALLDPDQTLRDLLRQAPALCLEALREEDLGKPLRYFIASVVRVNGQTPLFLPPGVEMAAVTPAAERAPAPPAQAAEAAAEPVAADERPPASAGPREISPQQAVLLAYGQEIETVASFLRAGLSVLVICEKLVVEYLRSRMALQAGLREIVLEVPEGGGGELMPRSLRQRQLEQLKTLIRDLKRGDVLVVPHLDLLAGGADSNLPGEARELIELLYGASDRLILAFADRALALSEVLASRFAVRLQLSGVPRSVRYPDGREALLGDALVTADERQRFEGFDAEGLYKNVAGLNPVRLREALAYAVREHAASGVVPVTRLYQAIRAFKAQTSSNFEVPDVDFDDIGGYDDVKAELARALSLMSQSYDRLDPRLQRELIPRGFIFHGPPGTGKTLFAKAVASQLNATIQVVSGPEVTDMYVGESERKLRELFAEARRNAPAILVFDEFDSIATQRSGRDDGGSRAGNAIVAQILTEMDGFRPDVPMLVIGTTNRLDIVDEALLRPSRFQPIAIGLPDWSARRAIATVHARHFKIEVSAELLDLLAAASEGLNGDEIRSLFRDACVGLYCETPPQQPDARRFGVLVGRIRAGQEQRAALSATRRGAAPHSPGQRPRPSSPMTPLLPETPRPAAAAPAGDAKGPAAS
jgi:transitional endoplasmic reticulum ATPase